jgi:hypothetical protein
MLRTGMVDNVVVFCGHSDKLLSNQTKNDAERLCVRERNLEKDEDENIIKNNEYLDYLKGLPELSSAMFDGLIPAKDQIRVIFGSNELKRAIKTTSNTLFIWDESHFAQDLKNKPYQFLKQIGVSPDGNQEILSSKGNYFLSVSATPISELCNIYNWNQDKAVVTLGFTENYNSVEKMMNSGHIQFYPYRNISSEIERALSDAASRFQRPSYALIRTSDKNEHLVISGINSIDWDIVHFNSKEDQKNNNGQDMWKGMDSAPNKNTVIIIKERCRMGEVVKKSHVSVMIETSKKSKIDTLLQSFIGRACGYTEGSDNIVVWVSNNNKTREGLTRYIEAVRVENPRPVLPSNARNVISISYRDMFPVKPIELKLHKVGELNRNEILLCVADSLSTPNLEWTFQQQKFAEATSNLILKSSTDPETNFITNKKGKRVNRIEVHDVVKNLTSTAITAEEWTVAFHNLYNNKYDTPLEPENIWTTTCNQVNEDGSKTIHEGYKINLFYFKHANCSHSNIGNLNNDANTVYVYGVSPYHHEASAEVPNREPPQIPKTSGKEVFRHGLDIPTDPSPLPVRRVPKKQMKEPEPPPPPPPPLPLTSMNQIQLFSEEHSRVPFEMEIAILKIFSIIIPLGIAHEIGSVKMNESVNREFLEGGSIHTMANKRHKINIRTTLEQITSDGYGLYTIRW